MEAGNYTCKYCTFHASIANTRVVPRINVIKISILSLDNSLVSSGY